MPARIWTLVNSTSKEELSFKPNKHLVVDDLALAYYAIQGGQFVGMIPDDMILDPDIIRLNITDFKPRTRTMFAYYFGKRHTISQIKHIVDYIKRRNADK